MQRTNIYLGEDQLRLLRHLSRLRNEPVAALVRRAVDEWLSGQGLREVSDDEWQHRFGEVLDRQRELVKARGWTLEEIERDVSEAIDEVRAERAARRR